MNFKVEEAMSELGINQGDHQRQFLFLIKEHKDFVEFMDKFYTGVIAEDLGLYRTHKRKQVTMSLEEFIEGMKTNKKQTLEVVVQEPVTVGYISLMDNSNITHNELYEKIQDLVEVPFINILKDWDMDYEEESDDFMIKL
ncbi:hypothetical protein [Aquibacillus kalidii]|uniref:hypothetical protein n=1 Tax=Aquibacillus kalidii TaxID=2762597 RepID=UPI0016475117|nr:hypothetical protein [Aquibacillus kalidii]